MSSNAKTLILIRHCHRDTSRRELDNGLSPKGQKQADWLAKFMAQRLEDEDWDKNQIELFSSPRLRCQETLKPLSEFLRRPVQVEKMLDEQSRMEGFESLTGRVQKHLKTWTTGHAGVTVWCSHGDWLPVAAFHLLGASVDFKKGCWCEVEWDSGRAHLRWHMRNFKFFYA